MVQPHCLQTVTKDQIPAFFLSSHHGTMQVYFSVLTLIVQVIIRDWASDEWEKMCYAIGCNQSDPTWPRLSFQTWGILQPGAWSLCPRPCLPTSLFITRHFQPLLLWGLLKALFILCYHKLCRGGQSSHRTIRKITMAILKKTTRPLVELCRDHLFKTNVHFN